jgi:peptide/nickel transport system ATP-binding protein
MTGALPIVEARDVRVYHNAGLFVPRRKYVTPSVSFSICANEVVGLSGPSGCGKTSLGKALLGLLPTWEGDVLWRGRSIRRGAPAGLRSRYGWIGQEPTLAFNPKRTILETLLETLRVNDLEKGGLDRIFGMCDRLNLDRDLVYRRPFEISPGQIQRGSLIRVFMLDPVFVVLDEPTSSLDPINQALIFERIFSWRREHAQALLLISHSNTLLSRFCSRGISLEASR